MSARDEDRALVKAVRAAMARTPLDITELNVGSTGGFIELSGKLRAPRGGAGNVNVRKEFQVLKTVIWNVRGVKGVFADRVAVYE